MTEVKKTGIIKNLANLVGITTGIILFSIGAITFLNIFLKSYIFKADGDRYGYYAENIEQQCEYLNPEKEELNNALKKINSGNPMYFNSPKLVQPIDTVKENSKDSKEKTDKKEKLTEKEKGILKKAYDKCLVDKKEERDIRKKKERGQQMAWGLSFLLVGIPLLWFYHRRRED